MATPEGVPTSLLPPKTAGDLLVACGIAEDNFVNLVVERIERDGISQDVLWNDVLNDSDITRVLETMRSVLLHFAATFITLRSRIAPSFEVVRPVDWTDFSLPTLAEQLDLLCDELALGIGCERGWARVRAKDILGDLPFATQKSALEGALFAVGKQHFDLPADVPSLALWDPAAKVIFGLAVHFALATTAGGLR